MKQNINRKSMCDSCICVKQFCKTLAHIHYSLFIFYGRQRQRQTIYSDASVYDDDGGGLISDIYIYIYPWVPWV